MVRRASRVAGERAVVEGEADRERVAGHRLTVARSAGARDGSEETVQAAATVGSRTVRRRMGGPDAGSKRP